MSLCHNRIENAGAMHLAECLGANTTLTSLDVSGNNFDIAANALRTACPPQCTLRV